MGIQIDRLSFVNYSQYGTCEINFKKSEKADTQLFAIIAQNGTGKTTVLKAITWCLYGKENPRESSAKTEARSLPLVNSSVMEKAKVEERVPVSVSFRFTNESQDVIELTRKAFFMKHSNGAVTGSAPSFLATVTPHDNSNTKTLSEENAGILVKQYFDEAIYNFYFFDGEKLKDFFATPLKESIYNIAQVNLLENTINATNNKKATLNRAIGKKLPDYANLFSEKTEKESWIAATTKEIERANRKLEEAKQQEKSYDNKLMGLREVEPLQREKKRLEREEKELEQEDAKNKAEQTAIIKEYLVLLTMYPRLKKIHHYISAKKEAGKLPPSIDRNQILELLHHKEQPCPLCHSHLTEEAILHLEEILNENKISSATSNFLSCMISPLEVDLARAQEYMTRRDAWRNRVIATQKRKAENKAQLEENNRKLDAYGGDAGTANVALWNKERDKAKVEIARYNKEIAGHEAMIAVKSAEIAKLEKQLSEYEKKSAIQEKQREELNVLKKIGDGFTKVRNAIVNETKKEMQEQTWKTFSSMIWKKNTFGSISIDDQYNVAVYNKEGHVMTDSTGATEAMALAYAFTLSVHQVSGKNCPLVIDSPLGRVSDENRVRMARALLEVAKDKQIIMLFTPDEFSKEVSDMYDKEATIRTLRLSADESVVEGVDR